jgi:hypothetical protein
MLREKAMGAMELALDGSEGKAQAFRGLPWTQLLHIAEADHHLVGGGKMPEGTGQNAALFLARTFLLRIRARVDEIHGEGAQVLLGGFRIDRAHFRPSPLLTQFGANRVEQNAVQPSGEFRASFKLVEILEGGEQGVLNGVFGLLLVAQHAQGSVMELGYPRGEKLVECRGIDTCHSRPALRGGSVDGNHWLGIHSRLPLCQILKAQTQMR